ncbi:chaperonin-like RBCX protein 1, chloroplastic [Rosa chinensis]|nr:chaperonin-like RBCX protein 1, chloroplastic [Rosa chinensis]
MYVPGFGEASPEAKAANNLHSFFTYIAVRIVTAQLEGVTFVYVRSAYCKNDFEWDNLKRLACKMVDESNKRFMRDYVGNKSCGQ